MVWPRATVLPNWRFCAAWLLLSGSVTDRLAEKPGLPVRVPFGDVGEFLAMASASACGYCEPMRQTTGFARLPDGPRIAFAVVGSGPAVVLPAWWVSHVVEDWHFDPLRGFVEGLAAGRMVVRYDRLGTGLSDRERPPETFTPEFEDATLCTVLDELGLVHVTLMGISCGGCIAVSFAARRPERVDRLVLYGSYAQGHALGPPQARTGMIDLVRSHWGLGSRLLADMFGPNWSPRTGRPSPPPSAPPPTPRSLPICSR